MKGTGTPLGGLKTNVTKLLQLHGNGLIETYLSTTYVIQGRQMIDYPDKNNRLRTSFLTV